MTDTFDDIDVTALNRVAQLGLTNSEYRNKHERADFVALNRFQRELLASVSHYSFVCGRAGGQIGKSTAAMLLVNQCVRSGNIPGRPKPKLERSHALVIWILSESGQTTIQGPQQRLLGSYPTEIGTGLLALKNIVRVTPAHGVSGLAQDVYCVTDDGQPVVIRLKQYAQQKQALTSEGVDLIVLDELPSDMGLFTELMQRVSATNGKILLVATPGKQKSEVLYWFRQEDGTRKVIVTGSVDDAEHISDERKKEMAANYRSVSEAEYRSRYMGEEFVAGGAVFNFRPDDVYHRHEVEEFGSSTKWLMGCDLGHGTGSAGSNTAFLLAAYHADIDRVYICKEFRRNQVLPIDVASAIRRWPKSAAPVAWGAAENQTAGYAKQSYRDLFANEGFRMLHKHATHADGSVYIETSVTDIQQRLRDGRLLIHPDCQNLIHELLDLERDEDGRVIDVRADEVAALRYLLMCLKSAKTDADIATGFQNPFERLYARQQRGNVARLDDDAGSRYFGIDA